MIERDAPRPDASSVSAEIGGSRWPIGFHAAAFFSFDVDGEAWLLGADPRNGDLPVTMSQARYGPRVGVFEILRVLRNREVPATFFVPSLVAQAYPDTVRTIRAEGHEIGLHGHLHERPDLLAPEQEVEITKKSIEILTELTGERPIGYRAPGAEVSGRTMHVLADHGVQYASQFMDDVFPYFQELPGRESALLELPIHWTLDDWSYSMVSPYSLPTPHANSIRTTDEIVAIWTNELDAIHAMGGLYVLVNHPQVTGRPGRLATLDRTIARAREHGDIWIANGGQINAHWRNSGARAPSAAERLARQDQHSLRA